MNADREDEESMKTRDVATIGLKILAVFLFFQFLKLLPTGLGMLQMGTSIRESGVGESAEIKGYALMTGGGLVIAIAYLSLSALVFFRANRLARYFVADPEDSVVLGGPVSDPFLTAAFQCLGVYALIIWMPGLIANVVRCILYGTWTDPQTPLLLRFYESWPGLVSPSVGVVIGLLLLFKARGLLRLIRLSRPMSPERVQLETGEKRTEDS